MKYLFGGLSTLITVFMVNGMIALLRKPTKTDSKTVILPKLFLIIGIICTGIFLVPAVIFCFKNTSIILIIAFFVFSLLGASLIIAYLNCRITYDDLCFISKNFWGFKRTFSYDQITGIAGREKNVKLFIGKCVVRIDEFAIGKREFLAFAKKQYRKLNDGNPIPSVKMKTDIFNGNVENPGEYIFGYSLIGLLCIGIIIFFAIFSMPKDEGDLKYTIVNFQRCEVQRESLHLYVENDSIYYEITSYTELLNDYKSIISQCESGATFEVGYIFYDAEESPHYSVASVVEKGGAVHLTLEAYNEHRSKGVWDFYLLFGGIAVLWFAIVAISIYVGRHPERFSRRFVRLFFKEGYIKIYNDYSIKD